MAVGKPFLNTDETENLILFVKQKLMDTYQVKLSTINWEKLTLWMGSITKIQKSKPGQKVKVSFGEGISRSDIDLAINDILSDARKLDFINNEVLLMPTCERINSLKELEERLRDN